MSGREEKVPSIRLNVVQYGVLLMMLVLAFGLWRLQVARNDKYDAMALQNRIKEVPILAPRGKILDREGRIIVDNYPSFSALLTRGQGKINEQSLEAIAAGLHLDPTEMRQRIRRTMALSGYQPVFLKNDITPDELAFIEAHRNEYPELETIQVQRRLYPKGGFLAHLIGYVGEVSELMLNQPRYEIYNPGDVVGQSGVEAEYNDILMGKNGSRRVLVNSKGKEVGELSDTPATPGKPLRLTIDIDLQIAAEQALGDKPGAIIAMDPRTGEVLAMVSRPVFDPNEFAVRISNKDWQALVTDPGKPLMNKAIQAQLAPGSVFKIIMSYAGWQEGVAQTLHVNCNGGATFYGRRFACWQKHGHGSVVLPHAITQSCDVFFYTLAEKLGIDRIAKYAQALGLGQKTGIDLPQEVSGVMPSEQWKIRNFKEKWFAGETISVGIGQGAVATTPVQLLRALGAVSTGGHLVTPHVADPRDLPESYLQANHYSDVKTLDFDPQGWEVITDAMEAVLEPGGTAGASHVPGVDFAGKTGSAQTISNALKGKIANKSAYKDNGWFVGFTPRRNSELIVAVLVEGGEHGSESAKLAAQVIKAFADKRRAQQNTLASDGTQAAPPANAPRVTPPAATPGAVPADKKPVAPPKPTEVTGLLHSGNGGPDELRGIRFKIEQTRVFRRAIAAPGMEHFALAEAEEQKHAARSRPAGWPFVPAALAVVPATGGGGKP